MPETPAHWFVVHVKSPSEELNALLAEGLIASGGNAVEESGTWLQTWLHPPRSPEQAAAEIRQRLQDVVGAQPLEITWEWRPDEDWLEKWREGLSPRRVGRRFIIAPSWARPAPHDNDIVITIDPQMAFGTGEHASTRGALRLLEDAITPGAAVLDAGTGSGVLAIAAIGLGAAHVLAVDNDPDAILNAKDNVRQNACAERIRLEVALVDPAFLYGRPTMFDVITANILSGVLVPLLPAFKTALKPGGSLLLAGILADEAAGVIRAAGTAALVLEREDRESSWWSARFTT